jgi:hypothetical protein
MTRLTLWLTMLLTLVLAAPAAAKEVVAAKVCGASGCREIEDEKSLLALHEGGPPTDPPRRASGFYTAEIEVRAEGTETFKFEMALVPRAALIRATNDDGTFTWMRVSEGATARYRRITRGLEPIAARRLEGVGPVAPAQARVDEVVVIPEDGQAGASSSAPVWPWIAGGVAALMLLGLGLYARARDHLGLHDHRNHTRTAGAQGGGARPPRV